MLFPIFAILGSLYSKWCDWTILYWASCIKLNVAHFGMHEYTCLHTRRPVWGLTVVVVVLKRRSSDGRIYQSKSLPLLAGVFKVKPLPSLCLCEWPWGVSGGRGVETTQLLVLYSTCIPLHVCSAQGVVNSSSGLGWGMQPSPSF